MGKLKRAGFNYVGRGRCIDADEVDSFPQNDVVSDLNGKFTVQCL